MKEVEIVFKNLPKVSLNEWYAGKHWSVRKKLKDDYFWLVKSQFKKVFPKNKCYKVSYDFKFQKNALDASNCIAMIKLIEDIIFESDSPKVIKKISITSEKSRGNNVIVKVKEV